MVLLQRVALRIKWVKTYKMFRTMLVMRSVLSKCCLLSSSSFSLSSFNWWNPVVFEVLLTFHNSVAFSEPHISRQAWPFFHGATLFTLPFQYWHTASCYWTCICFLIIVNTLTSNVKVKEGRKNFVLCLKLFWVITHMNSVRNIFVTPNVEEAGGFFLCLKM